MAIEIAEVIETGPGWNRVRGTDGNIYTLQGDYNWRSNNPGNIEYGPFAISQGAIGSGAVPQGRERGFAIFPTLSAGEEARRALQFESPRYRDLTIEQAISRYAPPNENNTQAYINAVTRAAGVPAGTKMSDLTPQQQTAFLAAQSQMEGMRQGDILNAQGVRLPPNEIPNMVGTALSVVPTPRVAPTPETMTPDLSLMRNPQMSSSARMAQVTPPLPQPRPDRMAIHPFDPAINTPRPNADGSISTEVTRTVQLPDGSWANVPSLWWGSGSTVRDFGQMTDDQLAGLASRYEQQTGRNFPRYNNLSAAETAAIARSNAGGGSAASIAGQATPLPRPRPSAPDIVTPSMAALNAPRGNVNATRAVDMLSSTQNPVTPRLTAAGDNIYSYHIPDMTPTAVVGGMGSLTPTQPRQSLPALPRTIPGQSQIERTTPSARDIASAPGTTIATIPTSGVGQPPATRTVPSVPYTLQPTAREIAQAPGVTVATIPTAPTTPQPMNMRSRDSVANAALGQRVATQMGPAFSQPSFIPDRLAPNPIVQPSFVPLNQPPIQVVPSPLSSAVPLPRRRPLTPIAPVQRLAPQPMPRMAQAASPLRVTVQGAGSYNAPRPQPMTPIQSLMAQGMSQAQAYNALTQRQPTLEDRVTGRTGLSSSGASAYSLSS